MNHTSCLGCALFLAAGQALAACTFASPGTSGPGLENMVDPSGHPLPPPAGVASDAGGGVEPAKPVEANGTRSIRSCETNIADDVPEFYRTYFKCVTVTKTGDSVTVATDALPPHASYYYGTGNSNFSMFDTSRGQSYKPNPNTLSKKPFAIRVPNTPVAKGLIINAALVDGVVASSTEEFGLGPAGVALDSVALFNPLARPGDDIENEKYTFDEFNAHPTPNGTYHYHSASRGPLDVLVAAGIATSAIPGSASVELFGIMCDGTVVLGCTELDGAPAPRSRDLDAQAGHVGDLKDAHGTTHFAARYHTHVCPSREDSYRYTPEIQYYKICGK